MIENETYRESTNYGSMTNMTSDAPSINLVKRKADALDSVSDSSFPSLGSKVFVCSSPNKMRRTMSRCAKSFYKLSELSGELFSEGSNTTPSCEDPLQASYADPLFCLGGEDLSSTKSSIVDASTLFPRLPMAVSEASYSTKASLSSAQNASCANSVPTSPIREDIRTSNETDCATNNDLSGNKAYGWFLELDDDEESIADVPCAPSTLCPSVSNEKECLAFVAPIAPKKVSLHEAELAWAQAADTVDDIFGDLDF